MLTTLDDYDWEEVFKYAEPEWVTGSVNKGKGAAFTREDVEEILSYVLGENDGDDWTMVGRLKDGRWFFITAGCDYTGWGCQEGGRSLVAETRELLMQFGTTLGEIARLEAGADRCLQHEDCLECEELGRACIERRMANPSTRKR